MEVVRGNVIEEENIMLGDIFQGTHSDKYYLLADLPDRFSLLSLDGTHILKSNVSLQTLKNSIRADISDKKLIHFPSSKYHLVIKS